MELIRHISFVDCPGHDILINIKLCILYGYSFITYSSKCHLSVIENMDLENIIIIQNKIDLIREEYATEHYKQIKSFV